MAGRWRKNGIWMAVGLLTVMLGWSEQTKGFAVSPLQPLIDEARAGETLKLEAGVYRGPVIIDKPLALLGTGETVIDGGGRGPVITVEADDVQLGGLVIRQAGNGSMEEKSGLLLRGSRADIRNNRFEDCAFGIILKDSQESRIVANRLNGFPQLPVHLRGNAVDMERSHGNVIADNTINGFRDGVYMERSVENEIVHNQVTRGRYGIHFMMQSDGNTVLGNEVEQNLIGIMVMGSDGIRILGNVVHGNRGYQGYGAVLYDTEGSELRDNVLADNAIGLKLEKALGNRMEGNTLIGNQLALEAAPDTAENVFTRNQFLANQWQVRSADAWKNALDDGRTGNFWDDYTGMDRDGDGIGDRPHETERWFSFLSQRHPALQLFEHSPAVAALMSAPVGGKDSPVDNHPLIHPLAMKEEQDRPVLWDRVGWFGAIFVLSLAGFVLGLKKERG